MKPTETKYLDELCVENLTWAIKVLLSVLGSLSNCYKIISFHHVQMDRQMERIYWKGNWYSKMAFYDNCSIFTCLNSLHLERKMTINFFNFFHFYRGRKLRTKIEEQGYQQSSNLRKLYNLSQYVILQQHRHLQYAAFAGQ